MTSPSSDRLATLAHIAALREDRAERAWRAATSEREIAAAAQTRAGAAHRKASGRADDARGGAMTDPCNEAAWVWMAATRASRDDAQANSVRASGVLEEAALAAARSREEHGRTHYRRTAVDDRLSRAVREERRMREEKEADNGPSPRPFGPFAPRRA